MAMATIDTSIPLSGKQPDSMAKTLSDVLKVKSQSQDIDRADMANQTSAINLQEKQAMADIMSKPENYTNDDGTVDFGKAFPMIMRAAPTTGVEMVANVSPRYRMK